MSDVTVLHDIDNLSDHEPLLIHLKIDVTSIALRSRIFTPRISWFKASENIINEYRSALSLNLKSIDLPAATLLCSDMQCTNANHHMALNHYAAAVTNACLAAAESSIPHTSSRLTAGPRRIPGWSEHVEPLREKSLFFGTGCGWTVVGLGTEL
jgi:hypothetical protein